MQPSYKMLGAQGLCKEGGRTHSHQVTDHWHASVAHPTTCDECNSHGPAKPHTTEGDGALSSHSPSDAAARQGEEVLWFMPACTSFLKGSPLTKHERVTDTYKTWYTWVRLGKDKDGDVVREHAHVLIAAARSA